MSIRCAICGGKPNHWHPELLTDAELVDARRKGCAISEANDPPGWPPIDKVRPVDPMERIAAACERVAAAFERHADILKKLEP